MAEQIIVYQACLVEDEPSHEIYANLIGHKPLKVSLPTRNALETQIVDRSQLYSSAIIPIDDDCDNQNINCAKEFYSIYRKRLAESEAKTKATGEVTVEPRNRAAHSKICLDRSNKGYRMLARMGWKENEGGLGKARQGILEPINAMKHSRMTDQTRIRRTRNRKDTTRAGSSITNARMQETKAERRKRIKQETHMEKAREKRARLLISSDLPLEYQLAYL